MNISTWPTNKPIPYARNARKIGQVAIDKVAASIKEFGFRQPIVVDAEGVIIVGHVRLMAAQKVGLKAVPVHVADNLTPGQVRAYRLMDNRSHDEVEWDFELLGPELADLQALEFDLSLTGFNEDEISALFSGTSEGLTDPDASPELPTEPVSVLGDVWVMGNHRIVCGSSTEAVVVAKALNGVKPHLMVTDPPYGVQYDPAWRAAAGVNKNRAKLGSVQNDDRADWREAWALFPGDVMYVWHAGLYAAIVQQSIEACGFRVRSQIVWGKDRFALSRGNYHWQHEPCWYAIRDKAKSANWTGDRSQNTLWQIKSREDSGHGHATQKPVECMRRPIVNNSSPGQAIYEPFSGSGTTIVACEMEGRLCIAIELNPAYVDVAVVRWQNFSGKVAVNETTGRTFQETKNQVGVAV